MDQLRGFPFAWPAIVQQFGVNEERSIFASGSARLSTWSVVVSVRMKWVRFPAAVASVAVWGIPRYSIGCT